MQDHVLPSNPLWSKALLRSYHPACGPCLFLGRTYLSLLGTVSACFAAAVALLCKFCPQTGRQAMEDFCFAVLSAAYSCMSGHQQLSKQTKVSKVTCQSLVQQVKKHSFLHNSNDIQASNKHSVRQIGCPGARDNQKLLRTTD